MFSILLSFDTVSQSIDFDLLKGLKARSIGPAGTSGRITSIDVIKDEPHNIYVGTASGGVWKSESGGSSWEPIFDEQDIQNIGSIAIDPSNSSIIWVGTGEGNPRNSHSSGNGIYRSLDGGKSWQHMGLEHTKTIHRIIVDPRVSTTIYAASLGSIWGPNQERGVYKSTNGGISWEKILYVNDSTGACDLVMDPKNPNKLIAGMWQYSREPWFFTSGGKGSGVYVTYDGGKNWSQKNQKNGLPSGIMGRSGFAIAPSNPKIIYALIEAKETGLYKSSDGGQNWSLVSKSNIGNRPFYYADIYVDPKNENRIYNLYSRVSVSEDGGKSFKVLLPYHKIHPDHHSFYIHPDNPNYIIDGNDGGLNISYNRGITWEFIDNLPVSQFYHVNVDKLFPYNVYGGMQDNGSWIGPGEVWHWGGIRNAEWQEILFGDGFDVMPKLDEPGKAYAMWQGGGLNLVDKNTGETEFIRPLEHDSMALRFNWNAALAQDPFDPNTIYYGSQYVHKSSDGGRTWRIISPDLTTNDSTKLQQRKSGGLTLDVTNAENHCTILSIAVSPLNRNIIWVGTDDGKLHVTKNAGAQWKEVYSNIKNAKQGAWIPQIRPSIHNPNEAFIVVNNYRRNDFQTYLYVTQDLGETFESLVKDNIKGYALSFLQDYKESKLLFLGTEQGLYISLDKGLTWSAYRNNYPAVSTMDIAYNRKEDDLILGTFGRSIYVIDNIAPLRDLAREKWSVKDDFTALGKSSGYIISYNRAPGARFISDGAFKGQNEPYGANIDFYINALNWKEKKKVKLEIFKGKKLIRNYTVNVDSGLNRTYWGLRKNGVRYPQYTTVKKDADPAAGRAVEPGNYSVVLTYLDSLKDTTLVRVYPDPRYTYEDLYYRDYDSIGKYADTIISAAYESFEIIKEIEKGISLFENAYQYKHDTIPKNLVDTLTVLKKGLKNLKLKYMPDPDIKGYQYDQDKLIRYLYDLNAYYGIYHPPSSMAMISKQKAEDKLNVILDDLQSFLDSKYKPFIKVNSQYPFLKEYNLNGK